MRVKQKKRVRPRRPQTVSQIRAAAGGLEVPRPEWPGYHRQNTKAIRLRLDADVLDWFKRQGRGYQTRMNRALRKVMMEERKTSGE
jgi:uncharacterized protein (DUF4415 family)